MVIYMIKQFDNFYTIKQLYDEKFKQVPKASGVHIIIRPKNMNINFKKYTTAITEFDGKNMLYDLDIIQEKYLRSDKNVLYIGKAGGRNKLRNRIRQLIRYGYNEGNNHRGGRAIWQIENNRDLLLGYLGCNDPENKEKELLKEYSNNNGVLPVANWKIG